MSDTAKTAAEILAEVRSEAAPHGWGPVTEGGNPITFARVCGSRIYGEVSIAGNNECGYLWDKESGKEVERCYSLVPLPAPPPEADPELLSRDVLEYWASCPNKTAAQMARECIANRKRIAEQDAEIERLTRERDQWKEACDCNGEDCDPEIAIATLTRELAEARKFNSRFRGLFDHRGFAHCSTLVSSKISRDYDLTQRAITLDDATEAEFRAVVYFVPGEEQPADKPATRIIPWTAATRPRGVTMLRHKATGSEFPSAWCDDGLMLGGVVHTFDELSADWQWSRDGVTWMPCGEEVPA